MKNEHDIEALWPELRGRGEAALKPNLAGRVLSRANALKEELSTGSTLTLGLATALACLTLTVAVSAWKAHHASDRAIAEWAALADDNSPDQDT